MNKIASALIIFSLYIPAYGISQKTADITSSLVALVCAGGSYKMWSDASLAIHPAVLAGASLVITGAAYSCLQSITPAGRLKRAHVLLDDISRHTLARLSFDDEKLFFDAVHHEYLREDLPLISAYNHLISVLPDVHVAFGLINGAAAELRKDDKLQEEYNYALLRANQLFNNISKAIKRIREHK